jgi:hypothetical protein
MKYTGVLDIIVYYEEDWAMSCKWEKGQRIRFGSWLVQDEFDVSS